MPFTLEQINAIYKQIKADNINSDAFRDSLAGIDTNDLQCAHVWDRATDTCQLCKKTWNNLLWDSKPCCGGGLDNALPAQYSNGKWHSIDCDTLKPPLGIDKVTPQIDYRPKSKGHRCECGGWATSNPNAHAHYCPEYKK